jgi:hypothetical protein
MSVLNSREVATGIWFCIFTAWVVYKAKPNFISMIEPVVKAALVKPIVFSFLLLLAYSLSLIPLLDTVGLWETHQIKNFVFWFFAVACVYLSKLPKIESDASYFSNSIKSAFKITAVLQFVLTVYTFSLWFELILVPITTFIVVMASFAKRNDEYKKVAKLCEVMIVLIGTLIIGFTMHQLITNFSEFGKTKTFYDFVVPTSLSLLVLPFYYLLAMYSVYERIFIRMQHFIKDKTLLTYAKRQAFLGFHFRFLKLDRWSYSLAVHEVTSKEDVKNSIARMYETFDREKSVATIPFQKGWSPQEATNHLVSYGLKSNPYKEIEPGLWWSSTPYLEIGNAIIPNNIAYYLEGEKDAVKTITIKANINEPDQSHLAISKFLDIADALFVKALSISMPIEVEKAICNKEHIELDVQNRKIQISSSPFINKGYDIKISLTVLEKK